MNLVTLFQKSPHVDDVAAGTTIFEEGSDGAEMYVILEGEVDLSIGDQVVKTLSPGDFMGEMALIAKEKRSASAITKTDCRLASLTKHRFLIMVQETPFFALHVMRVFAERLRDMNEKLDSKSS